MKAHIHSIKDNEDGSASAKIDFDEEFLEKASDSLLGHTAYFFTTGFKGLQEEPKEVTISRLNDYWKTRLETISNEPEKHKEEAKGFTGWIINSPFDSNETLQLFWRSIQISEGKISKRGET